jgi:hypothetical protein
MRADMDPQTVSTAAEEVTGQMLTLPEVLLPGAVVADVFGGAIGLTTYVGGALAYMAGQKVGQAIAGSGHPTRIAPGT